MAGAGLNALKSSATAERRDDPLTGETCAGALLRIAVGNGIVRSSLVIWCIAIFVSISQGSERGIPAQKQAPRTNTTNQPPCSCARECGAGLQGLFSAPARAAKLATADRKHLKIGCHPSRPSYEDRGAKSECACVI